MFRAHTAAIRWVDISSDNLRMCTASADKSIKVWLIILISQGMEL